MQKGRPGARCASLQVQEPKYIAFTLGVGFRLDAMLIPDEGQAAGAAEKVIMRGEKRRKQNFRL